MLQLPPECCIADVGTGTGSWLGELATQLPPSAKLHGFDISPAQFRPDLPQNVSLQVLDAKQPFPREFHGRFDVVHLRLLVTAMDKEDWKPMTANVIKLLKPGGVIQWGESNYSATTILRGRLESTTEWLHKTEADFINRYRFRLDYGWSTLPEIFRKLGLVDLRTDVVSSDRVPETRKTMTRVLSLGVFEWLYAMTARGQVIMPASEISSIQARANADIDSGAYTRFDIHVAIGRKPA